ncbi:uncharacterized protein LOC134257042 isoform X2 [Saccostrea cucullata]|uniref:uncharacterized protein LOC134257042 isoform X2 n=1 Tax=Saccostrea cuccullata TaxID=36930 RepID=UPI002ED17E0E
MKDLQKEPSEEIQMKSSEESRTESSEESREKSCTCNPKDVNLFLIWILAVIPKVYLYGWLTIVGKQTWSKRWYLQALTFLHLIEICIEGFPQFLIEYNEMDMDLFLQRPLNHEKWAMLASLLGVTVSIASVSFTLDEEEDVRDAYYQVKEKGTISKVAADYWDMPDCKRNGCCTCLGQTLFVSIPCKIACFLEKMFDVITRWFLYVLFIQAFPWWSLLILLSAYALMNYLSSGCLYLYDGITKDGLNAEQYTKFGYYIGMIANVVFSFDWRFYVTKRRFLSIIYFIVQHHIVILVLYFAFFQDFYRFMIVVFTFLGNVILKLIRHLFRRCFRGMLKRVMEINLLNHSLNIDINIIS